MKKCSTPSCENEAHACGLCLQCYGYIYKATKRGIKWMVERRRRVTIWQERLDSITSRANVVHLKRKRA